MMNWEGILASFLGGALLASLGTFIAWGPKISSMETLLKTFKEDWDKYKENPPGCMVHHEISRKVDIMWDSRLRHAHDHERDKDT